MHYSKIASRVRLRKFASALISQRAYPAWIDAGTGVPFSASTVVTNRVRDSLVLRLVAKRHYREISNAAGAH